MTSPTPETKNTPWAKSLYLLIFLMILVIVASLTYAYNFTNAQIVILVVSHSLLFIGDFCFANVFK